MIISVRKWLDRAKFIALFLLFTFVLYHVLQTVSSWMAPHTRYDDPGGRAVKASAVQRAAEDDAAFGERLRFFYWYGE